MEIKLSKNIRMFRKSRGMTQEQLAEALGVTVGAVYKWEKQLSTPDISLILELADFFGVSTDRLLGYEWRNRSLGTIMEEIQQLMDQKSFESAASEAEKALQKYPNHFELVYQSAQLYLSMGEDQAHRQVYHRAVELLEHACELIAQNQDENVSEVSLRIQQAKAMLWLGNIHESLEMLKKYNVCGINNAFIGMVLADFIHDVDAAEKYLAKAFTVCLMDMDYIMTGYMNLFFQRKNFSAVQDCVNWLRNMLRGIQPEDDICLFDKYDCVLQELLCEISCFQEDLDTAREHLRSAMETAIAYDQIPAEQIPGVRLYTDMGILDQPMYNMHGRTAWECLERRMDPARTSPEEDGVPYLLELWQELQEEVL